MKKIIAVLLLSVLCFTFVSCNSDNTENEQSSCGSVSYTGTNYVFNPETLKKDEPITVNYEIGTTDVYKIHLSGRDISNDCLELTICAFGFLITYGESSARSMLTVEVPNPFIRLSPDDEDYKKYDVRYKMHLEDSFTLSDYRGEDALGYVEFSARVCYTETLNGEYFFEPFLVRENELWLETCRFNLEETDEELKLSREYDLRSNRYGYGKTEPPRLYTRLDGENHNYGIGLYSYDYSWRGRELKDDDATISEWGISSDATGFFEIFNPEEYRHDITEYKVKRVYSNDLSGGDVREEKYEHIIHNGFFDIFREHKNYVTFTPQKNRIFVFEIEYEYGVATYKIKLLKFKIQ